MDHYLAVILGAVFVNNVVLVKVLGLCPFFGASRQLKVAVGMGLATAFVLTLACGAGYLLERYLLGPYDLAYLRTVAYILVIASAVGFTELYVRKTSPGLHQILGVYLPLITTNCAVLGVPLLNLAEHHGFAESLLFGLGSSMGFTLAMVVFAGLRERLDTLSAPGCFRGSALAMVTAGLMSLAFMGFSGIGR